METICDLKVSTESILRPDWEGSSGRTSFISISRIFYLRLTKDTIHPKRTVFLKKYTALPIDFCFRATGCLSILLLSKKRTPSRVDIVPRSHCKAEYPRASDVACSDWLVCARDLRWEFPIFGHRHRIGMRRIDFSII